MLEGWVGGGLEEWGDGGAGRAPTSAYVLVRTKAGCPRCQTRCFGVLSAPPSANQAGNVWRT